MTNKICRIDMKNGFTYIGFLPKGPGKSDIALEKFTTVKTSHLSPEPYPEGTIGAQEGSWYLPRLSAYAPSQRRQQIQITRFQKENNPGESQCLRHRGNRPRR